MRFEFGKKIATLRKERKVTQAQLAEYLMVQPQTVSRWEVEGGVPDVTLLPRIALFFGITLDELFGMTDMEQLDRLVYKYSVLRDERSFEEVMRSIESAIGSIAEQLHTAHSAETESLQRQRDQLLAWKVHIYIQKSRAAQAQAEKILDELMADMNESHPLHLSLTLQKQQFCIQRGEGRRVLEQARQAWETTPSLRNLHRLLVAYLEMERGEEILQLWEQDNAQQLVSPPTADTLPLWDILFRGAVIARNLNFFEKYFALFREYADAQAIFSAEWQLAILYSELGMMQEKLAYKDKLLEQLDTLDCNEYLRISYREQIAQL